MNFEEKRKLLFGYYNLLMDEFNGYASEEAINIYLGNQKHDFKPDPDDFDTCLRCGKNFRNTDVHKVEGE